MAGFVFVVLFLILKEISSHSSAYNKLNWVEKEFQRFIEQYNRSYVKFSVEYDEKYEVFRSNLELYDKLNSNRDHDFSAIYGVNKFSDLSQDEFRQKYLSGYKRSNSERSDHLFEKFSTMLNFKDIPKKFDWRERKIITEPRNQGNCGACWAFASIETVESMYNLRTGQQMALSVQEMIDCSFKYNPILSGCMGGDTCEALYWARKNEVSFIPSSNYPLKDSTQSCNYASVKENNGTRVENFTCDNFKMNESRVLSLLSTYGPLTVSVDASNWNNYMGGVIQFHCGEVPRNHAVQIVGYDLTGAIPYYIVKNSWGKDWGLGGYVYVKYGNDVCLIAEQVSSVLLKS